MLVNKIVLFVTALLCYASASEITKSAPDTFVNLRECLKKEMPRLNQFEENVITLPENFAKLKNFLITNLLEFDVTPVEGSENEARLHWQFLHSCSDFKFDILSWKGNGGYKLTLSELSVVVTKKGLNDYTIRDLKMPDVNIEVSGLFINGRDVSSLVPAYVKKNMHDITDILEYLISELFPLAESFAVMEKCMA